MKKSIVFYAILFISIQALAQEERFLNTIFDEVKVTTNVTYGENASLINLLDPDDGIHEALPELLIADIYEPIGDELAARPLVIVIHSGNFLPVAINWKITGSRQDSSVVEICTRLARMGYVAAAIDYRLGWNPLASTYSERALGLIQAIYRGTQDARTAIRYFKRSIAEEGNPYRIDSTKITLWGNEAGGSIALATATLDRYDEILNTTHGPSKFMLDTDYDDVLDTPMVIEEVHGDIEGKTVGIGNPPHSPMVDDTLCYPNHIEYSSDFQLCVNIGGQLADISWLEAGEVPIISVQSAYDMNAIYDDGFIGIHAGGFSPTLRLQGGKFITTKALEVGNNQIFVDANFNDVYTQTARKNSANAAHEYLEGLYPFTRPPNSIDYDEGVPIDWWNPDALSPEGIPWNILPHPSGFSSFHDYALALNEGMSAAKARTTIDTLIGYFAPRACVALGLDCGLGLTNVRALSSTNEMVQIYPNPSTEVLILEANAPIQSIAIYDLDGQLLQSHNDIEQTSFRLYRHQFASGIYIAKVHFEHAIQAKKIVFD